ncbi:MAG TPA: RHS repeat-associated core domain-containing protein, partial [Longimicrobium sp.]|nr:RHS repeat-associated core domain-containing protein [Longimicrobium sp.]
ESRVVDNRASPDGMSNYRRAFEEYRYDALGRRVLTRARRECHQMFSGYCELGWVRRTVWDGDRELYEIQAPSSGEVAYDDARKEYDTTPVEMDLRDGQPGDGNEIDPNPFYGRVAYTYGPGIDQPISVVRMGYADMRDTVGNVGYVQREPFAIVPLWNSRGQAGLGAFADGTWRSCVGTRCIKLTWPEMWAGYARPQMFRDFWHGTLLQDKQDGSGLNYRRNRYYDPATGRFTQEDPIGLAGGVNVYGFADGDPVSYSDPYGLCAKDKNGREDPNCRAIIRFLRAVAREADVARGKVNLFAQAADKYEATNRRVEFVNPQNRDLNPENQNDDGNPETFALGRTLDDVYLLNNALGVGDFAAAATHEALVHEGERGSYIGDLDSKAIDSSIWWQLPNRMEPSAYFWRKRTGKTDEQLIW